MCIFRVTALAALILPVGFAQTGVGQGAPNGNIRQAFVDRYNRGSFAQLVSLPPVADVRALGQGGFVQEFFDTLRIQKYAIVVKGSAATATAVPGYQLIPAMWTYYQAVGAGEAGYPIEDTNTCPAMLSNSCIHQSFDLNQTLFVWTNVPGTTASSMVVRNPFQARWLTLGGVGGLGPPTNTEAAVTSSKGTTATVQTYLAGALYNITSGNASGRLLRVVEPIYRFYLGIGGFTGSLGLPQTEELAGGGTTRRQTFEGGSIEYRQGQSPVLRKQVGSIQLSITTPSIRLSPGQTQAVTAFPFTIDSEPAENRDIFWTTSNSRVAVIQGTGQTVAIRAVAGGVATITATSEGRSSEGLAVFVSASCCAVGEGSPAAAIQQAFQDAVVRNRLAIQTPVANPVRRAGNGYVQDMVAAGGSRVVLAKLESNALAYPLTGALLAAWEMQGGPGGALGFPISDPTAQGRQLFEGGALAGQPVQVVSGAILARWANLGYETGLMGSPAAAAEAFLSFAATTGSAQAFRGGLLVAADSGLQAGRAYPVTGAVAAAFAAEGGVNGALGIPLSDEFQNAGRRKQEFEGGSAEYTPPGPSVDITRKERRPVITATPPVAIAGNRVRLAIGGFAAGSRLRVTFGGSGGQGQPEFETGAPNGAFAWDAVVAANARSSVVTLRAVDAQGRAAEGSYEIRALTDVRPLLRKSGGDNQTGVPGAVLPVALRVQVLDENSVPLAGYPVRFTASPGATVLEPSAVSDAQGFASALLRLPASESTVLVTAAAGREVVTFAALSSAGAVVNFPRLTQTSPKGAFVAAAASVLRLLQIRGELPQPNGLADPTLLGQYLRNVCGIDNQGVQICDGYLTAPGGMDPMVNPWRVAGFAGGGADVVVQRGDLGSLRDAVGPGSPVILALELMVNGGPGGAHFIVATGVGADGSVQVFDPSFGRTQLAEYLDGFTASGRMFRGTVASAFRIVARPPRGTGFVVSSNAAIDLASPGMTCALVLQWPDTLALGDAAMTDALTAPVRMFRVRYCPGVEELYQLAPGGETGAFRMAFNSLANPPQRIEVSGSEGAVFRVSRQGGGWAIGPQTVEFTTASVVNGASFEPGVAPGSIISIFGNGLAAAGTATTVEVGGVAARVLFQSPFQVNVFVPATVSLGAQAVRVRSPYGAGEQAVMFTANAPAVFLLGPRVGAITLQDGSINAPLNPVRRGQFLILYTTGLGATVRQGNLEVTREPVRVVLRGMELTPTFAGLAPGFVGLYQINVQVPANMAPGSALPLVVRQGGVASNQVEVAVQ
ncbi:MAG: hypothetical protein FJW40_19740 [Acidobacteria bacterium]|nr:hypothetical protein [Acidobacteriota bacterium]